MEQQQQLIIWPRLFSSSLFTSSDDLLGLVINRILSRDMQEDVTRGTQGGQKDKFLNKRTLYVSIHTLAARELWLDDGVYKNKAEMMSLKWKKPLCGVYY